ncbi:MAG: DUF2062 domain-containing protein [Desulfobacterales bacterium]|nr:DUF2062 domain-containing protein [Desulfobacterales bacterium]
MDNRANQKIEDRKPNRLVSAIKKTYARFLKIRGNPREVAFGFALGLFVAMSPTMGFQMAIAIPIAALFKWNKLAAAMAVWVSNPFTAPFIYGPTYFIGAKLSGMSLGLNAADAASRSTMLTFAEEAPRIFGAMTLGGVVLGFPLAVIGYYCAYFALQKYQMEIKAKIVHTKEQLAKKKRKRRENKARKKRKKKIKAQRR